MEEETTINFDKIDYTPAPENVKKASVAPAKFRHLRLQMAELRRQIKDADNRINHLNEKRKKLRQELKYLERFYAKVK